VRVRTHLEREGVITPADTETWTAEINDEIGVAIREAELLPPPSLETLFSDVYAHMPAHLAEQMRYAIAMGEGTKFEGAFPL
jgi:TPP-dependent pyruvate/acetoin dehydrogenase alpha subunit